MSQTISSLMHREVIQVGPDDTLQAVEAKLVALDLSWVPVVDASGVVMGVISSADLVRAHAEGTPAPKVSAWQLCTYKPVTVRPDATLSEVARLMTEGNIHHVVVAEGPDLKGVVSSLDFVRTFVV
ncbi:MAG: CBS domain-containing protein [Polaromonas sp.]|uniref:CBS domain-containing protein n=1 Tax=Polaromonas sp. TaxID=1869339 RepID=UPI00272F94D1|nr:CBS domain-containing protein [Polaromonas sp.]MDP2450277.1 CBS domain-containing protein [Polaromonas sp.]MDP3249442.1 CBS domain-containing protein [Polaromonas sp.]MDP3753901.1 CBS domain-containing protein [Polaromonas sp.]MDP3826103.1 CBS domain-containing protein [Polaromonas sp.]